MSNSEDQPGELLVKLASVYGIASQYWSFFGERISVPAATLRAVLAAMGVDAATDRDVEISLAAVSERKWRQLLPHSLVVRQGEGEVRVYVEDGHDVSLTIHLEDGTEVNLPIPDQKPKSKALEGVTVWRLKVTLPTDLPLGWHTIRALQKVQGGDEVTRQADCVLAVTPHRLTMPPLRGDGGGRGWGIMAQAYSVRSRASWGLGDYADLADLASLSGSRGADFLLVNPIHAGESAGRIEPSPYLPASRRFLSPLYIRPEDIREAAYLPSSQRALVEWSRDSVAPSNTDPDHLDRDASWSAKKAALEVIFKAPRSARRERSFRDFVAAQGVELANFALWCAITEHYDGIELPSEAQDLASPLVAALRDELSERVLFYCWLQWVADQQLGLAQSDALESGMAIGLMHDLAVGVHPHGGDAWSMRGMFASGMTVGAPPDMYNQQGQDWSQPPWRPDALARSGYAPVRNMIRYLLRHAGALRIDHIIGFFRLWWIPEGAGPDAGTYVSYDHEAMIGVLALEAERAGAVIIGEDLGNVEPWVREYLADRGILGTSVLWFERHDGHPVPPEHLRQQLLATVTTHDLPPTAGYLACEHVDIRARLGLLTEPEPTVRAAAEHERDQLLGALRERGLIGDHPTERETVEALHRYLVNSPAVLIGVALTDAVGERRAQNQPGTNLEYPNWQIPLADSAGHAVMVDDLDDVVRFQSLTHAMDSALRGE